MTNIKKFRNKILETPKILSTGNPNNSLSLAYGISTVLPDVEFISRSTGFDLNLTQEVNLNKFISKIKEYNIFINLSYIDVGYQVNLLNTIYNVWKFGHVINIGSVHDCIESRYGHDKNILRSRSLELNNYRIRSSYICLGEISQDHLTPIDVGQVITWILSSKFNIPIIGYEPEKGPW